MTVKYKNYVVDKIDDQAYSIHSADNITHYNKVYFQGSPGEDAHYPASKHGIRVQHSGSEVSSAILCEVGGGTTIHDKSFLISGHTLYICCYNKVYSLNLPDLSMNWSKRLDPATCFGIYSFDGDFVIHGELTISRMDQSGQVKWEFGARDIFVTQNGTESVIITGDKIELKDWAGYKYTLDKNGAEIN